MLRILAGLGKVGIGIFQNGVLIPMSELLLQPDIPRDLVILRLSRTFRNVLIAFVW